MKEKVISGIQQIGIGVSNVYESWEWYKTNFGFDIKMFEEEAVAELMLPYTGGKPRARHAILALNIQGGGGFEIWQYTERQPAKPKFEIQAGDIGIYIAKIKAKDVEEVFNHFKNKNLNILSEPKEDPRGEKHFFVNDPFGNIFQVVKSKQWLLKNNQVTGASYGAIIGVSDIEKSKEFYASILGYDKVVYDETTKFDDFLDLPGGKAKIRRVLLNHSKPRMGAFSPFFGESEIELIQVLDRKPRKIFDGRYWGDLGFIHLCYDIREMHLLREECKQKGHPFTVDSEDTFDMGEAAGEFSYIEDPDGTLIEFVETHKIPVSKKLGWYLNLKKRKPEKPLPKWLLRALTFNRVKKISPKVK